MTLRFARSPRFLGLAGLVVLIAAGAAAALLLFQREDSSPIAPSGNTYVEGVAGTWERINPLFAPGNRVDEDLSRLVFAGLTRLGADGTVMPDLAESWDVTPDGRTWTFRLRRDLRWHDGESLTAADVVFTVGLIQDSGFQGSGELANLWAGVTATAENQFTVVFHLAAPFSPFLARNTTLGILPRHLLDDVTPAEMPRSTFNSRPVGAGPYRLASINSEQAELTAFSGYHAGRPQIDTLRIRFYSDLGTAAEGLRLGALNGLLIPEGHGSLVAELGAVSGATVEARVTSAYLILYLNNARHPFNEAGVRRAISLAIDRDAALNAAYQGSAVASSSAIAPGSWAYTSQYDRLGRDLRLARELLAEAGWEPNPSSGVLTREGVEFRFLIRTDNTPAHLAVASEVAAQLNDVGIRATVASTSFAVLRRDFLAQRQYDAALAIWEQGADPDPYSGWHSSENGTAGLNFANFADVVVDELVAQARTSPDLEVRRENYRQFQEVWLDRTPSVVIGYPQRAYIHSTDLDTGGIGLLFHPADRFWAIARWRVGG